MAYEKPSPRKCRHLVKRSTSVLLVLDDRTATAGGSSDTHSALVHGMIKQRGEVDVADQRRRSNRSSVLWHAWAYLLGASTTVVVLVSAAWERIASTEVLLGGAYSTASIVAWV